MPYNEKSLQNLQRGSTSSFKKKLTKSLQTSMVEWLAENRETFEYHLATLDPKDWVAAYLKLTSIMTPKHTLLDLGQNEESLPLQWIIQPVSPNDQLSEPPLPLNE